MLTSYFGEQFCGSVDRYAIRLQGILLWVQALRVNHALLASLTRSNEM